MSTTIDTNVVQLKFDNKQFEENCRQSLGTLEKLKQAISESNSGNALNGLNNSINISNLEKSVDTIANRFTFLGNLAFKIKDKVADAFLGMAKTLATTVPNIIKEGGWQRAMNIENAKFQLQGLKVAWDDVKDSINAAVDGTAYGLDAAAKAASQLVASNVELGDSMTKALTAISGVAAMTNAEYEDIAPIFTTIAGQGKVMTMQLRQLENRGLNAAAELAKAMGTTEAAVREMVTNGEIDFNTFSTAMYEAFGPHAKEANRTFDGVIRNIKAALKKIGAEFAAPVIEQDGPVVKALQQLRLRINDVKNALGPLVKVWTEFVYRYAHDAKVLLQNMDMSFMQNIVSGLVNIFNALLSVLDPVRYAIADILLDVKGFKGVNDFAKAFSDLTAKLVLSKDEMEDLRAAIRGIISIGSILLTGIKKILGAILKVKPETVNIRAILLSVLGTIGDLITYFSKWFKETNILEPIITKIGNTLQIIVGVIALVISKIIELGTYISKLNIVPKIIDGITIAVKLLAVGVVGLATLIKNFIVGTVERIPGIITAIKNELSGVIEFLKGFSIFQKAADAVNNLVDSFKKLLNPEATDVNQLEKTVTIVDEAVALAGPPNVSKLDRFKNALHAIGDAIIYVKDKIVAVLRPIKEFIQMLGIGGVVALAFTAGIAAIGVKLMKTMESVTKTFNSTASVLRTLSSDGIMGLIFGKKQQVKIPFLLQLSVAIGTLAASFKLLSTINTNKLKEVGIVMGSMAGGLLILITAMTAAQKILGKGETLAVSGALLAMASAIAIMSAALLSLDKFLSFGTERIQKAGAAITQLSLVLGVMAVALTKLAPSLSTGALSLLAMAYSIKILVGALAALNELTLQTDMSAKNYDHIWGKAGLLVLVAGSLVVISGIAAKLGTNSLLGILVALLSLKAIIPLANSVAESIQNSIFADAWKKLVDFWKGMPETLKTIGPYILAAITVAGLIVGAVYTFKKIKAALTSIGDIAAGMKKQTTKLEGFQKALARLSLVPVIIALTGMMVAIAALVVVVGKIKIDYLDQAITVMEIVGLMFLTMAVVVAASKNSKPSAVIGAMVGLTMMFSELIVLSFLIEQHGEAVRNSCIVISAIMLSLAAVFYAISKASDTSTKTLVAIGMIAAIVAEIGGILYILSQQDWASMLASGAAMSACMLAFSKMLTEIGKTGQSFTKNKFLAIAECAGVVAVIGASLALATLTHDWKAMLAAGGAMTAVMTVFGLMMEIVGQTKWNAGAWSAVAAIAILAVSIGAALAIATLTHDWQAILAAAGAMSLVMGVFGGMAILLGNAANMLTSFVMMASIAVTAVAIGASLAMLCQYPWQDILAAAVIMAGLSAVLGVLAIGLGSLGPIAAVGAIVLDLIAVAMLGLSTAATLLLSALTAFLPTADQFLNSVLRTLVTYSPDLPQAALGLTELAGGLALVGAAGLVLNAGGTGLLLAAAGITALVPGSLALSQIDFVRMAEGLAAFVVPSLAMAAVGPAMLIGAAGLTAAAVGITAFAIALRTLTATLNPALINLMNQFTKKAEEAKTWGSDLIQNFISGIKSKVSSLVAAVRDVAQTVKDYLGFSEPDLGPLSDFHTYAPDMMDLFISGISGGKSGLTSALTDVGNTITGSLSNIDLSSIGSSLGIDLGSGVLSGASGPLNQLYSWITNLKNETRSAYGEISKNGNTYRGAAGESLLTQKARKEREAAREASSALDDYSKSAKGAGKSSKEASEKVEDLTNGFKELDKGEKMVLSTMEDNLDANLREHTEWAFNVRQLIAKGYDEAVIESVKKAGVGGHQMVKAMLNATEEEVPNYNAKMKKYLTIDEETEKIINGDYGDLGSETATSYLEGFRTVYDTKLAKTLQDALDPFGEFDKKAEKGAAKLLQNMKSQVEGFQTWGGMINELQHRNLNQNALEYLIGLGTSGYEDVTAIFQMTDDQIAEFNTLWEQQEHLGEQIAGGIQHEMNLIALGVNEGFKEGVDPSVAYDTLQNFAQKGLEGATSKEGYDEHSPSKKMIDIGKNVVEGLKIGVKSYSHLAYTQIIEMAKHCIDIADDTINYDAGVLMGEDLMKGLKSGIDRGESGVIESIKSTAKSIIDAAKEAFDINSPSKVFREIGLSVDEGLADGIDRGTNMPSNSITSLADNTVQMMNDIIKNIAENVNDSPEFQPVIRPTLDLTALQNGKSSIRGLLNNPGYTLAYGAQATRLAMASAGPDVAVPVTSGSPDVVSAIGRLRNDLNTMTEQLTNMQVVLDGRTVVGELAPAMDNALGMNAMRAGRGN